MTILSARREICYRSSNDQSALAVRWAVSLDDFKKAAALVHKKYSEKGYIKTRKPYGLFFNPHSLLSTNGCLIAEDKNKNVVATLGVVSDSSQYGLPMDSLFSKELQQYRNDRLRISEIHSFAVDDERPVAKGAFALLFRSLHPIMQRNADVVCHEIHPSHFPIYHGRLYFESFGESKYHQDLSDAPALPCSLTVKDNSFVLDALKGRLDSMVKVKCPQNTMTEEKFDLLSCIVPPREAIQTHFKELFPRIPEAHYWDEEPLCSRPRRFLPLRQTGFRPLSLLSA